MLRKPVSFPILVGSEPEAPPTSRPEVCPTAAPHQDHSPVLLQNVTVTGFSHTAKLAKAAGVLKKDLVHKFMDPGH